ncbi:TPA: hypothetical protein ACRZ6V_001256 [Vibrio harveyi]
MLNTLNEKYDADSHSIFPKLLTEEEKTSLGHITGDQVKTQKQKQVSVNNNQGYTTFDAIRDEEADINQAYISGKQLGARVFVLDHSADEGFTMREMVATGSQPSDRWDLTFSFGHMSQDFLQKLWIQVLRKPMP